MTIYYVAPDLVRPSGGVRTIYRHVDALNRLGLDAAVVHAARDFRCAWFENQTTVVNLPLALSFSDTLVVPEDYAPRLNELVPGVPKIVFNQNAYRTFSGFRDPRHTTYTDCPDLLGVVVVSEDSRRYVEHCFPDLAVHEVRHAIDPAVFRLGDGARRRQVAVVPTKRPHDLTQLLAVLGARDALRGWDVARIEQMSESEVAATLRASYLFLSMNRADGFGLPPAEAIASGCRVIGFHGMGAREFFRAPYALAIDDGDIIAFATAVEDALATADLQDTTIAVEGAAWITGRYSIATQASDLGEAFARLKPKGGGVGHATLTARAFPRRRDSVAARWEYWARRRLRGRR